MNTTINSETLEKVEYLRSKADISYEEALSMLERFDGDLTRVLIELERANRIRSGAAQTNSGAHSYSHRDGFGTDTHVPPYRHHNHWKKVTRVLFHNNLQITRGSEIIMNMPVACYVLLLFAPHIMIMGVVAMLLFGCHISVKRTARNITQQDVAQFARNAAENVHNTINNISDNFRKGFEESAKDGKDGKDDNGSGEGGEFTID
ncbi:hypothetical protein FACS1894184_07070 [Clostridia bacterium]|nr:hypothetical protein FACS1894184_07070 [Clostridia bacterium]